MKEKDLYVDFEAQKSVYYVEKEDDSYGPIISGSHLSANYLDDFWEKKKNLENKLRHQIMEGEISPIYYYMILQEIGEKDLAKRVGLSLKKLQKAYKPEYFENLSVKKIRLLAEVFNIPAAALFQNLLIKEEDRDKLSTEQSISKNKLYQIVKVAIK